VTESNTLRARTGERPTCWNRPDYPDFVRANLRMDEDGPFVSQIVGMIPNPMSKHCASWSVAEHENPAVHAVPGREGWLCLKCRHLPQDPRVIARAHESERL